jgi:ketosteroid isomerase-like protein
LNTASFLQKDITNIRNLESYTYKNTKCKSAFAEFKKEVSIMGAGDNKNIILKCVELYNKGTLEWVNSFYSRKLEWIELPGPGSPNGKQGDFASFYKASEQLLRLFPDRTLTVLRSVAESECVVLEQQWQGTASATVGNFHAGNSAKLRVASFFTLEDGLIIKQTDYCVSVPS